MGRPRAVVDASWRAATSNGPRRRVDTAGLIFEHKRTATTKLLDALLVEAGASSTSAANDIGVQVSMTDTLALAFGYRVRYKTNPAPGTRSSIS